MRMLLFIWYQRALKIIICVMCTALYQNVKLNNSCKVAIHIIYLLFYSSR